MNQVPQKLATASQRKRPGPARTPVLYSKQRLPSGLSQSERHGPCRWSTVQGFKGRTEMVEISLRSRVSGPAQFSSRASSVHTQQISQSSLWADILSHRQTPEWAGHMKERSQALKASKVQTADEQTQVCLLLSPGAEGSLLSLPLCFMMRSLVSSSTMLLTLLKL